MLSNTRSLNKNLPLNVNKNNFEFYEKKRKLVKKDIEYFKNIDVSENEVDTSILLELYNIENLNDFVYYLESIFYSKKFESYQIVTIARIMFYYFLSIDNLENIDKYEEFINFLVDLISKEGKKYINHYEIENRNEINYNKIELKKKITSYFKMKIEKKDNKINMYYLFNYLNNINE